MAVTSRQSVVLWALVVFLVIGTANSHNWVQSPSRARQANVAKPCPTRVNPEPQVQTGPGQSFQIEWTTGHGDSRTKFADFIVIHASNFDKLKNMQFDSSFITDYINNAPPSAKLTGTTLQKTHLVQPDRNASQYLNDFPYFTKLLSPSDPDYLNQSSTYIARSKGTKVGRAQLQFNSSYTKNDIRVSYVSDKYPWIEAIHRFEVSYT
eukprot:Colp12_sorted_trinity150504_noHs@26026